MDDQTLVKALQVSGYVTDEQVSRWKDAAFLMAAFEAIGRHGTTAVVKVDGGRPEAAYTVVVSGSRLGEAFFRRDGSDVLSLLREAVEFYSAAVWSSKP
jgi:hypothetical protein